MIGGGAKAVMQAHRNGCKYRLSLAERFDCTETVISQLLVDSSQTLISEWLVTLKLYLIAGFTVTSELMYLSCKLHLVEGFRSEANTYLV